MKIVAAKHRSRLREEAGLTLLEVALAMGIFAIVMSVTAQVLISFSGAMDVQEQRQEAVQHCRAVLAQIRQDRETSVLPFPNQVLTIWPNGREVTDPTLVTLADEVVTVSYVNTGADPLSVTVTSAWTDKQGRAVSTAISTLLTGTNQ